MKETKKIRVFSFVRFQTVVGFLLGLVAGVIYSFGGFIIDLLVSLGWMTSPETPGLSFGTVLAFGALIGMPLIFAGFGLAAGFLGAVLFNALARWLWWVEVDFGKK